MNSESENIAPVQFYMKKKGNYMIKFENVTDLKNTIDFRTMKKLHFGLPYRELQKNKLKK